MINQFISSSSSLPVKMPHEKNRLFPFKRSLSAVNDRLIIIKEIKKRKSMKIRMNAFVLFCFVCLLLSFLFRSLEIRSNDKSSSQNPTIDQLVQLLACVLHWRMWCNTGAKRCCTEERRTSSLCNFKSDLLSELFNRRELPHSSPTAFNVRRNVT